MQAYYRTVLGQDAPASPEERQALRRAMIDYGALQPSPVQRPADSAKSHESPIVAPSISPTVSTHEVSFRGFIDDTYSQETDETTQHSFSQSHDQPSNNSCNTEWVLRPTRLGTPQRDTAP